MMKNVIHNQKWPLRSTFQDDMRQLFGQVFGEEGQDGSSVVTSQWVPRVDVREDEDCFLIHADLPGIDPEQVEVWMDKGILSIKGERESASAEERARYSRIERRTGSFHRRFALPDSADPDGVTATGHNGVLEVRIPKRPESTPRRIQVAQPRGSTGE